MAKKLYVPVNGLSKEIKKFYVSVNGVSRKVTKAYVSVNGLSKLFFVSGGGVDTGFWFYYSTITGKIIDYVLEILPPLGGKPTYVPHIVTKSNNGVAFYCMTGHMQNRIRYLFVFSTDQNAILFEDNSSTSSSSTGSVTIDGDTWYYRYKMVSGYSADVSPKCCIINSIFQNMTPQQIVTWIVNNRIYTNDFAENYQVGQTYNLVKGNIEKTVRKFLAIYLYKMISWKTSTYDTSYNLICSNIENIVSYFVQHSGGNDIIDLWADYNSANNGIRLGAYYSNESTNNVLIENLDPDDGGYAVVETDAYLHYSSCVYIDFNGDGTIAYETPSWTADDTLYIGKGGYGWDYMHWSNVGLKFNRVDIEYTGISNIWVHDQFIYDANYKIVGMQMHGRGNSSQEYVVYKLSDLKPEETYTFTLSAKLAGSPASYGDPLPYGVFVYDTFSFVGNKNNIGDRTYQEFDVDTTKHTYTFTFTPQGSTAYMWFEFGRLADNISLTLTIEDLSVI